MTERQRWNPRQVRAVLQARGYDVDPGDLGDRTTSISARRERAGRAQLFAIDSGGRFRAEVTATSGESRRATSLGVVPVVMVAQSQRLITVTGILPAWDDLPSVLAHLDTLPGGNEPNV